ncbi:MAG: hypothetical protein ASARMPRED_004609 [Alectoria sarmentosa]|nr:MAG: hypothetical protein ASARMPRED_004609 [Alectoria sarmentosa]
MGAGRDRTYSTLEAVPRQIVYQTYQQEKPLPTDLGKQVAPHEGKQVSLHDGKQHMGNDDGIEVAAKEDSYAYHYGDHHVQVHRPSRKKRILVGGAIGLIAIFAAVLGTVLGIKHKRSATTSSPSPSNTSVESPPATPPQRNIAALSFASNSVNNTRVYFQDNVGQIMEAANSADNTTWIITRTGIIGKNGSAIAAAVSRPGFPLAISVFYLDIGNLIHETTYTPSTGEWTSGALSGQGYTAMPNSSLAAMYNQCSGCANTTIISFQDENGFVQIGNLTSDGWTLTQLGSALDPEMGTGLALQPFYLTGAEDQINLYHQKSNLNMSLASWKPASRNNGFAGWSLNEQIYNTILSGSAIAAASSYSNVSTGFESWIEVLSISDQGIEVNTWSGAIDDWLEQYTHPSAMVNSTGSGRFYGVVAVTAMGSAFGVVKQDGHADGIENWQVQDDTVDWSLIGNVDLSGAWG